MSKRKPMPKHKPGTAVSIESTLAESLGPLLAKIQADSMKAAMDAVREELKGQAPQPSLPAPVSRAKPELRGQTAPDAEAGRPWHPAPGSRYVEPGTRQNKKGRLDSKPSKSKVFSAFLDPGILATFREKCQRHGITQRFGLEQALVDWIKKPGVGEREVEWKR